MKFKLVPEVACDLRNRLKVSPCQSDMKGVFYRPVSCNLQTGLQNTRWSRVLDYIGTSRLLLWWYFTGVSFKLIAHVVADI